MHKPRDMLIHGTGEIYKKLRFCVLDKKLFLGREREQLHPQWIKYPVCLRECSKTEASGYGLLSVGIAEASHSAAGLFNAFKYNCNF